MPRRRFRQHRAVRRERGRRRLAVWPWLDSSRARKPHLRTRAAFGAVAQNCTTAPPPCEGLHDRQTETRARPSAAGASAREALEELSLLALGKPRQRTVGHG